MRFTFILLTVFTLQAKLANTPQNTLKVVQIDYVKLSQKLLENSKEGKSTTKIQEELASADLEDLEASLQTNEQRLAFWLNIYNAYILIKLSADPDLYTDRGKFFKIDQIPIAGEMVSFAKIEHGLVRKSQWEYGLGYIRRWFPDRFERKLRVYKRDFRVHFALNCGAKDCPPVAIYRPKNLNMQLNKATHQFLKRSTTYDPNEKIARVTPLFSWFRGDFCGKSGTKRILEDHGLIPDTKGVKLEYTDYDWTLMLNNFVEL